jgi:hypothetical protein
MTCDSFVVISHPPTWVKYGLILYNQLEKGVMCFACHTVKMSMSGIVVDGISFTLLIEEEHDALCPIPDELSSDTRHSFLLEICGFAQFPAGYVCKIATTVSSSSWSIT